MHSSSRMYYANTFNMDQLNLCVIGTGCQMHSRKKSSTEMTPASTVLIQAGKTNDKILHEFLQWRQNEDASLERLQTLLPPSRFPPSH